MATLTKAVIMYAIVNPRFEGPECIAGYDGEYDSMCTNGYGAGYSPAALYPTQKDAERVFFGEEDGWRIVKVRIQEVEDDESET